MRHPYAEIIGRVEKPARYLGGEYQSVHKDHADVDVTVALAFPDVYDIGMSHLGTKILYSLLNASQSPRIACERAFAPWVDMEAELRKHGLPLVTLESATPLSAFDVVGVSLQYEMTYTNVLTLLDLGGIPLRSSERGDDDPLVLGGGPTATHPEPVAPFFDAFLIGEAEEVLPGLLGLYKELKRAGVPRRERLVRLAERGGLYVPELYATRIDERTGLEYISGVADPDPRVPARVARTWVRDLNRFPFPADAPVPYAEAVFDRVSVEIARGCTEGCRFCQAGMIYRPVRERDPDSIVRSVLDGVRRGGYDETSLTALSTADVSCITPLVKRVMGELRKQQVSLSISSLRAYGLNEDLLDEISSVRATGLTFAPEAGTQRMRDVINKNVTEEDITRSAERVFSRGWSRMKLYFMIGLPTEADEDVAGIAKTGGRLRRLGRQIRRDADVTVSVSTHVPKPHTPFQWCQMDSLDEIVRKQRYLRDLAKQERVDLKWHEAGISHVEGILSRGDRRLADVIEAAWGRGARFDGWDDRFSLPLWQAALAECGVDPATYLRTLPVDAPLPWDHIDIGLEPGFLAREYKKALKDRLSPPCGKPYQTLLHHTNVADAEADERPLICYHCGVACDLDEMRSERIVYLTRLGALRRPDPAPEVRPAAPAPPPAPLSRKDVARPAGFLQSDGTRVRLRLRRTGRAGFISHLDSMRLFIRVFRRAGIELEYSRGFHPKPQLVLPPALGLGVASIDEYLDARVVVPSGALSIEELVRRLNEACPGGLSFLEGRWLAGDEPPLMRRIAQARYVATLASSAVPETLRTTDLVVEGRRQRERRRIDVGRYLVSARRLAADEARAIAERLDWPAHGDDRAMVEWMLRISSEGGAKPAEVIEALTGLRPDSSARYARTALLDDDGASPLSPAPPRAAPSPQAPESKAPHPIETEVA